MQLICIGCVRREQDDIQTDGLSFGQGTVQRRDIDAGNIHIFLHPDLLGMERRILTGQEYLDIGNAGVVGMDHRSADGSDVRIGRPDADNRHGFAFGEGGDTDVYKICLPREKGYLLSLESGSLTRFVAEKGILEVELALGETAVLLLADEQFPAGEPVSFPNEIAISAAFQFQKDRELTIGEHGFVDAQHKEESIQLSVGSWEPAVGAAYSGSGTYTAEFALPEALVGKSGMLDLGTVCYSAKVSMNGHCLGTVLMPPYRLEIPVGLLREKNELSVTVTNTSANWYVHTDYFDRWQTHQLSPYFEAERNYAKDSVNGGLYGPVKLFLE